MPKVYSLDPPSQNYKLCPLPKISYGRVLGVLSREQLWRGVGCVVLCTITLYTITLQQLDRNKMGIFYHILVHGGH